MAKNKNKKPRSSPTQERTHDSSEGFGRGGQGRGRGGRGGRGGSGYDSGGGDEAFHWRDGFRGGHPSGSGFRGGHPHFIPDLGFGRGRGGRGRGVWMSRGRGFRGRGFGGFTGDFRGGRSGYHPMDEIDFEIQYWDESPQDGRNTPRGRGRGSPSKFGANNAPRGRGGFTPKLPPTSSLSSLWYEERPLLRPIKFVRSLETATLFQEAEELLEPSIQNPETHIPTAGKISRVFSTTHPHLFGNSLFKIEEGIEEVDFEDLALVHGQVLNPALAQVTPTVQEDLITNVSLRLTPEPEVLHERSSGVTPAATKVSALVHAQLPDGYTIEATTKTTPTAPLVRDESMVVETETTVATTNPEQTTMPTESLFPIGTDPSASRGPAPVLAHEVLRRGASLRENVNVENEVDSEDDVIVYDAPNPRIFTPKVEPTTLANISRPEPLPSTARQINPLRRNKFVHVVGRNARRGSSGVLGVKRKRLAEHKNFTAFGAINAEARLRSQDEQDDRDPKRHLRRQGDSDLDWGDKTDTGEEGDDPIVATAEGMDLDPDLVGSEITTVAMKRFVEGINGNHVAADDVKDTDTEGDTSSDDETSEDAEDANEDMDDDESLESDEERMLIEELIADQYVSDFSDDDDDDDDDDDELDPRAGFQARLDRLRSKQQKIIDIEEDEDEMNLDFKWSEGEDVDELLEEYLEKYGKNRTTRNAVFNIIQGQRDEFQPRASSSKRDDLPTELQEQWEKDRLKKAKYKREREIARLSAALDPLITKKGGKKSKKAMLAAARLDPSILISHRIVDMVSVERQIRRFLADNDRRDMALPACNKSTRKKIHTLAALFGLGSRSDGRASKRYTTLFKKSQSGKNIDEGKVARLMKGYQYRASYDVSDDEWDDTRKKKGKGKGKGKGKARFKEKGGSEHLSTREGDVVGNTAPKIDETNIGFMMLASMGWSDGASVGLSGGLDVPLTAVIKKTKLGLGASVSTKS